MHIVLILIHRSNYLTLSPTLSLCHPPVHRLKNRINQYLINTNMQCSKRPQGKSSGEEASYRRNDDAPQRTRNGALFLDGNSNIFERLIMKNGIVGVGWALGVLRLGCKEGFHLPFD